MLPSLPPIGCNSPFKTIHCEKRDGSLRDQVVYNVYFRGLGTKLYTTYFFEVLRYPQGFRHFFTVMVSLIMILMQPDIPPFQLKLFDPIIFSLSD